MGYITTISITPEQKNLATEYHISWTEAARVGMGVLLAERGLQDYDGNLNQSRKIVLLNKKLEETSQELAELKEKK